MNTAQQKAAPGQKAAFKSKADTSQDCGTDGNAFQMNAQMDADQHPQYSTDNECAQVPDDSATPFSETTGETEDGDDAPGRIYPQHVPGHGNDGRRYAEVKRHPITNARGDTVAYFSPKWGMLYRLKGRNGPPDEDGKPTRIFVFEEMLVDCPILKRVFRFADAEDGAANRDPLHYEITLNGVTATVTDEQMQDMTAWRVFGVLVDRDAHRLMVRTIIAQRRHYAHEMGIIEVQGRTDNGLITVKGRHAMLTVGGQIVGADGLIDDPTIYLMPPIGINQAAYQYWPEDQSLKETEWWELVADWHFYDQQRHCVGMFALGATAAILANDVLRIGGSLLHTGITGTGKTYTAWRMACAHGHRILPNGSESPSITNGYATPTSSELALTHKHGTVMSIEDIHKTKDPRMIAVHLHIMATYNDPNTALRSRSTARLSALPGNCLSTPVIGTIESDYLPPDSIKSDINRLMVVDFGTEAHPVVDGAAYKNMPRANIVIRLMPRFGFTFLRWLMGRLDTDPGFHATAQQAKTDLTAAFEQSIWERGALSNDGMRTAAIYVDYLMGWWLIGQWADAQGWATTFQSVDLLAWAADTFIAQQRLMARMVTNVTSGTPFVAWVCATIRKALTIANHHDYHVRDRKTGGMPLIRGITPERQGWGEIGIGERADTKGRGAPLGHVDDTPNGSIYLIRDALWDVLTDAAGRERRTIYSTQEETWRHLAEDGLIVRDKDRKTSQTVWIDGRSQRRLAIPLAAIWSELADAPDDVPANEIAPPAVLALDVGEPDPLAALFDAAPAPAIAASTAPRESDTAHVAPAPEKPPHVRLSRNHSSESHDKYPGWIIICDNCGGTAWQTIPDRPGRMLCVACLKKGVVAL